MVVSQRAARRGITLIEILFSIGIVVVGIFGVMALLMLAGARARQAIDASATSATARQALGQLSVRGWQRTDMVLIQTPAGWQPLELIAALRQSNPAGFRQIFPDGRMSYCLDPLFVGHSLASGSPMGPGSPESRFPYGGSGRTIPELTMPRASVARQAGTQQPLTASVAARYVTMPDDLRFDLPEDRTLLPQQVFDRITPNGAALRRANAGEFTWFATVTPGLDMVSSSVGGEPNHVTYVVSVVVLKNRNPRYRDAQGNPRTDERQVQIRRLLGNGRNGGTMQVVGQSAEELAVQRGRWVMLSGLYLPSRQQPTPPVAYHAWYRVIGLTEPTFDTSLPSPNQWTRFLTLEGPDWPHWLDLNSGTPRVRHDSLRLTIVDRAVSVSSKTFRFEPLQSHW